MKITYNYANFLGVFTSLSQKSASASSTLTTKVFLVNFTQVKAYVVSSSGEKAKDPIFGLTMASSSQASDDIFR